MPAYSPCPACQRHVRRNETACPFCAVALPPAPACSPGIPCDAIPRDAKRATVVAISLGLASVAACSDDNATPIYGSPAVAGAAGTRPTGGSNAGGNANGGNAGNDNEVPVYGNPPVAGAGGNSSGGNSSGGTAGTNSNAGTGSEPETDAGSDAEPDAS